MRKIIILMMSVALCLAVQSASAADPTVSINGTDTAKGKSIGSQSEANADCGKNLPAYTPTDNDKAALERECRALTPDGKEFESVESVGTSYEATAGRKQQGCYTAKCTRTIEGSCVYKDKEEVSELIEDPEALLFLIESLY